MLLLMAWFVLRACSEAKRAHVTGWHEHHFQYPAGHNTAKYINDLPNFGAMHATGTLDTSGATTSLSLGNLCATLYVIASAQQMPNVMCGGSR